jgi:hypothetical protein
MYLVSYHHLRSGIEHLPMYLVSYHHLRSGIEHLPMYLVSYHHLRSGIEISVSTEARDLLFFGWTCRIQ